MKQILFILLAVSFTWAQEVTISGTVIDAAGAPLQGVEVKLVSASIQALTGADGSYSLVGSVGILPGQFTTRSPRIYYRDNTLLLHADFRQAVTVRLYDMLGTLISTVFDGTLGTGTRAVPLNWQTGGTLFFLTVSRGGSENVYKLARLSAATGTLTPVDAGIQPAPLAKQAAVDWIQASKTGYATFSQEIDAYTGVIDIVMTASTTPDFGPNVHIFDPSMNMATIQSEIDGVHDFHYLKDNEFTTRRAALLFKPGQYNLDVGVGFYMQALGLGLSPDDVEITGRVDSRARDTHVLSNFWRSAENIAVQPRDGVNQWLSSQASPLRRMHIKGDLQLSYGMSSGGYMADSKVDAAAKSGSQQQFFSRNDEWGSWPDGGVWNMVFVGCKNAPAEANWCQRGEGTNCSPMTVVNNTPVIREKPFLTVTAGGSWAVFVPALKTDVSGTSWSSGNIEGESIPIESFYVARSDRDDAASINAALAQGLNLLVTPGVYNLDASINITRPNTVVLGLGLPSLIPTAGNVALSVSDVGGVSIAGLMFDAGPVESPALLQVGEPGSSADHSANPTFLYDVFARVGSHIAGTAKTCVTINSNHVVGDHFWLWRADHGPSTSGGRPGWDRDICWTSLEVNGNDVTIYGLFNEHFMGYMTLWNGERGRTYFYQCEMPYDVPNQDAWMSPDGSRGYASYKVADGVTDHKAWGFGIYCFFPSNVVADNAVEVPMNAPGITMTHMMTRHLNNPGGIAHVINGLGDGAFDHQEGHVEVYP